MPNPTHADRKYALAANTIRAEEIAAATDVLQSGRLTMGQRVRQFEEAFADWTGAKHAVMVNSGSSANLLAVESQLRGVRANEAKWKPGDEVLVPALSWPTTVWPLAQLGLVPVFVDVEPGTLAIDLDSAARMIGPRTVGLFLIHVLGQAPDMSRYVGFCEEHGISLLEDTCESLGAHSGGKHLGTLGTLGTFSTYFSHHITTIEGGVVVTSDTELADDLKSMRSHGWVRDRSDRQRLSRDAGPFDDRFLFVTTGYNLRPTEIAAAIGLEQLKRLPEMLESRAHLAAMVADWVEAIPWLRLVGSERLGENALPSGWRTHSWMTLPFEVYSSAPVEPPKVSALLEDEGVETRPVIAGNIARHPAVQQITHRSDQSLDVSDRILSNYFMIGCHPFATPAEIEVLEAGIGRLASL